MYRAKIFHAKVVEKNQGHILFARTFIRKTCSSVRWLSKKI